MQINTDNKELKKALTGFHKYMVKNGAWFHEGLEITGNEGGLTVNMNAPCNPGNAAMRVPVQMLVPSVALNMTVKGDDFVIDPDIALLNKHQLEIGRYMMDVYNLTGRVNFHRNENVFLRFRKAPELLELLIGARDTNTNIDQRRDFMHGRDTDMDENAFTCETFLHSRVLGHKTPDSEERIQKIMPIVDYLNHHFMGSPFITPRKEGDAQVLKIQNKQPFIDRRELFAFYGMYDALDTLLNYGFTDAQTPFVRSIPMEISLDGTSKLIIKSHIGMQGKKPLNKTMKDLMRMTPNVWRPKDGDEEGNLHISHLHIPVSSSPHAMRRILRALINTSVKDKASPQYVIDLTLRVEHKIIESNIDFYRGVLKKLEDFSDAPTDLVDTVRQLCDTQLTKLYKYRYDSNFLKQGLKQMQANAAPPPEQLEGGIATNEADKDADENKTVMLAASS